jgi:hypothetical protein
MLSVLICFLNNEGTVLWEHHVIISAVKKPKFERFRLTSDGVIP